MADFLTPLPAQAEPVLLHPDGEPNGSLPMGRRVTGVVDAQLDTTPGSYRYQLTVLRHTLQVQTARALLVGSVLDLVPVHMPGGTLNLILNEESGRQVLQVLPPAGDGSATPAPAPPTAEPAARPQTSPPVVAQVTSDEVRQALRDAGLAGLPREQLDVLAARLENLQLPPAPAARAAAQLLDLRAPITDSLLRGGALVESAGAGNLDVTRALVELVAVAREVLGDDAAARTLLARFDAVLRGLRADAAGTPAALVRAPVHALHALLEDLVSTVLRDQPLLAGIRAEQTQLARAAQVSAEADLETRVGRLLGRHSGAREGGLEPVGSEARRQALELLQSLERDAVERHVGIRRLQPALVKLHARLEVAQFLQLTEWLTLARDEGDALGAGLWGGPPERLPMRFTVRDERSPDGEGGAMGFRIDVDSPSLGPIRVAGRLHGKPGATGELEVHLAAADPRTRGDLQTHLAELHAVLEEHEYRPALTVGALAPTAVVTPVGGEPDDRLDISA